MPLRRPQLLYIASALGSILAICLGILAGGAARQAALVVCTFALMIGAPIAILLWFGSVTRREEKKKERHRQLKQAQLEAFLWQRTLLELQTSGAFAASAAQSPAYARPISSRLQKQQGASQSTRRSGSKSSRRSISLRAPALISTVASALGLAGCFQTVNPAVWPMVRPGMPAPELVALAGAPQQIKTNGPKEVWQYCDDFLRRRADYYVAVFMENDLVVSVRSIPVYSYSGCEDFYRTTY